MELPRELHQWSFRGSFDVNKGTVDRREHFNSSTTCSYKNGN